MTLTTANARLKGMFDSSGQGMERFREVFVLGVEKEIDSDMLLDDDCLFRLTHPTTPWPLANLWCQSLR